MVGGLSAMALNGQIRSSPAPRSVAVPVAVILKRCSSVPAGACALVLRGVTPPVPETSRLSLPVERTISVELTGTANGPSRRRLRRRRLAGMNAGQHDRRLAGIGRRRHPGVDAEIRRQHHALPIERRRDAFPAFAAGGEKSRDAGEQHQRAQRIRVAPGDARRRLAGFERARRLPTRARHGRSTAPANRDLSTATASSSAIAVAGRWRRPLPRSSRRRPSRIAGMRSRPNGMSAATTGADKADQPTARAERRQPQPQPEPGQRQEQTDRGRERRQRRPQPLPQNRPARPPQRRVKQRPRRGALGRSRGRIGASAVRSQFVRLPRALGGDSCACNWQTTQ